MCCYGLREGWKRHPFSITIVSASLNEGGKRYSRRPDPIVGGSVRWRGTRPKDLHIRSATLACNIPFPDINHNFNSDKSVRVDLSLLLRVHVGPVLGSRMAHLSDLFYPLWASQIMISKFGNPHKCG